MKYTPEQKKEFLNQVENISSAFYAIMQIDSAFIINHVGLKAYPFHKSFDELYFDVKEWQNTIEKSTRELKLRGPK